MTSRRTGFAAAVLAAAFAAAAPIGVRAQGDPAAPRDRTVVRLAPAPLQSAGEVVPNPPPVEISPRRAAAFAAALVAALLLLQYAHRRKPFILLWAAGWLLIAPAQLVLAGTYRSPIVARGTEGLSSFLGICTAALFLWSADVYRQTGYVQPKRLRVLVPVGVWFLLAPLALGTGVVLAPGYVIAAALLVGAGSMYAAVLLERRMIGAGLVAFVLLGLAIANVTTAFAIPRILATGQFTFDILVMNAVLYTFGALGIHLMIFEDMT